jgi:predicted ABC-type ATPase
LSVESFNRILKRRPIVIALAGPNGAGKSTFFEAFLSSSGLRFVNADVLALSLGTDAYAAAEQADAIRHKLVELRESFIFETVLSDPIGEKVLFLRQAQESGYTVLLIFIGLESPELSDTRVAMRAAAGGHDVPQKKLVERYPRTLENLKRALAEIRNVWVYDHSDLDRGYKIVAVREEGQAIKLYAPVPHWLRPLLP